MSLVRVQLDEFLPWFEAKLDEKHGNTVKPLKTLFLSFICLVNQLIHIYIEIRLLIVKNATTEAEREAGRAICDNSINTLKSMTANFPICLDLSYCERFAKDFEEKLNLLFWYYHSLSHLEEEGTFKFKHHNEKIVEGIKKLFGLAGSIKDHVKETMLVLKNMSDYKKLFSSKISSIKSKIEEYGQASVFFREFERMSVEYGRALERNIAKNQEDRVKGQFMAAYFRLINHYVSTQVELESVLQLPIRVCQELKNKKKLTALAAEPNWAALSKYASVIVKPNFVAKHLRKIKVDEFVSFVKVLYMHHKDVLNGLEASVSSISVPQYDKAASDVRELIECVLEDMKELEKVEKSSVGLVVGSYRDSILPGDSRKFFEQLAEYQVWMHKYYKLNEEIKSLQKIVQTIVAKETNQKVELIVMGPEGKH